MKRVLVVVVAVVASASLIGLLVYGLGSREDDVSIEQALARGERPAAPSRELAVLGESATRSIADLRGKVVVLNFWASWCGPCKVEAPVLDRAQKRLERAGAGTVLGVTRDDATPDSLKFVRDFSLTYPSLRDVDAKLAREYGSTRVPETFVIDARGRIADALRGQITQQRLDEALAKAMQ
ncbi:TlpA disulfide reductase family protein [soil metagenome]